MTTRRAQCMGGCVNCPEGGICGITFEVDIGNFCACSSVSPPGSLGFENHDGEYKLAKHNFEECCWKLIVKDVLIREFGIADCSDENEENPPSTWDLYLWFEMGVNDTIHVWVFYQSSTPILIFYGSETVKSCCGKVVVSNDIAAMDADCGAHDYRDVCPNPSAVDKIWHQVVNSGGAVTVKFRK